MKNVYLIRTLRDAQADIRDFMEVLPKYVREDKAAPAEKLALRLISNLVDALMEIKKEK